MCCMLELLTCGELSDSSCVKETENKTALINNNNNNKLFEIV